MQKATVYHYSSQVFGYLINDKLNWNAHTDNIVSKLMRGNPILYQILRTIYFAIFHSYLIYVTTVWRQTRITKKCGTVLQKKALRIMSIASFNSHSSSCFHDCNILKFCDIINIKVCAFINNCFNSNTYSVFAERFKLISEFHAHNTRSSSKGLHLILQDLEDNQ